jgi:hypothetical protein
MERCGICGEDVNSCPALSPWTIIDGNEKKNFVEETAEALPFRGLDDLQLALEGCTDLIWSRTSWKRKPAPKYELNLNLKDGLCWRCGRYIYEKGKRSSRYWLYCKCNDGLW